MIIAGRSTPDKPYYERRQTTNQARGRPGMLSRASTYQTTERSAYLSQQNAYSGHGFSPAAAPASHRTGCTSAVRAGTAACPAGEKGGLAPGIKRHADVSLRRSRI